jgi:CRP/FNR family transcriptional regulator, anaerobic regulatory protein
MHSLSDVIGLIQAERPEAVQTKDYKRGQLLLAAGSVERNVYYIKRGAVRALYCHDAQEFNIRFGYKGSILTSLPSFFDGSPSQYSIEALRKTTVQLISRDSFMNWVQRAPGGLELYLQQLEQLVSQQMEREIDLLNSSPAERLDRVLARSPQLFQEVPAYHIANYLRMTPETLEPPAKILISIKAGAGGIDDLCGVTNKRQGNEKARTFTGT